MIKVEVHSTQAVIREQAPLTVGLRGATARFAFGADWASLIKTAVFRQGEKTVTVADIGEEVTIPWEVLTLPGVPVQIGVYGSNSDETVAIPTLWTQTDPVRPGADPEGDPSAEPTPGLWEQMQGNMGSLEQLDTTDKTSLVAAINEANRAICLVTVFKGEDGAYSSNTSMTDLYRAYSGGKMLICRLNDLWMPLTDYPETGIYIFTAVRNNTQHRVTIFDDGTVTYVSTAYVTSVNGQIGDVHLTIPSLVSQLENDSGFLTKAPVTSVDGQTGDVKLRPPVYLVTLNSSNKAEQPFADIVAAYRAGYDVKCSYKGYLLPLKLEPDTECIFSGTVDTTVFSVVVYSNGSTAVFDRSLAQKDDIPSKISQLENDSGYLTKAPVTSVNGQTGDVTVPVPVEVTVEPKQDGGYSTNLNSVKIMAAYGAGSTVCCKHGQLTLPLVYTSLARCVFSGVHNGRLHTVSVGSADVEVSETPLASGTVKTVNGLAPDENGNVEINGGSSDGLSDNVKALLLSLFENAAYINPDMGNTLEQLRGIWFGGTVETFSVTNNLTNVTNSNTAISVTSGASYRAALTPSIDGGIITNVTVTMGGVDISDNYKDGVLNIPAVTGDIVITASADLLYWDYTQGDIVGHGFYKAEGSSADATYSLEDDGLLIVNNSETKLLTFLSYNTFNCSDVEITYIVKPVELLAGKNGAGVPNNWAGLIILGTPYATLSTHHGLAVDGTECGDYVLPALNVEYTIKIRGGVVYVNGANAGTIDTTEASRASIGCNGTMYIKSVSVTPLSEG